MRVKLDVNNQIINVDVEPNAYLLDTLRANHITSVKRGCESSSCGVCTVLVDNKPVASCTFLTVKADGHKITTVEGIKEEAEKLGNYMGIEGADQCGYCNPSLALTAYALKLENPEANNQEIKEYFVGNLCRCTGYQSQHTAIRDYLEDRK
jgi:carbon-monoxide dehydrogenase small subunit